MPNRLILFTPLLLLLLILSGTPAAATAPLEKHYIDDVLEGETYMESSSFKLLRGLTNIVTSAGEIPKQMVLTTQDLGALGLPLGLFKGIGMTLLRTGTGVWETASFPFPNSVDGDFGAILNPEFVWNPSPPVRR